MPSSSSEGGFSEIRLNPVPDCFENPPAGFTPFDVECIPIQDFNPGDIVPGGRTLLVTPYVKGIRICSGQYGQFQVLQGLGGQINRALYLGESVGRVADSIYAHEVEVPVDCDDTMEGPTEEDGGNDGDRGLAIRDRGRWYVIKLAQGGGEFEGIRTFVEAWGGQNNPYAGTDPDTYKVPAYRPFIFPRFYSGISFENPADFRKLHALPNGFSWEDNQDTLDTTIDGGTTEYSLPYGLGWARLLSPTRIGKYAWDAQFTDHHYGFEEVPDTRPTLGVEDNSIAFIKESDKDEIILAFSEPLSGFYDGEDVGGDPIVSIAPVLGQDLAPPGTSPVAEDFVTLVATADDDDPGYVAPVIQRLVYGTDNTIIVELDRDIDFNNETLSVSVTSDFVVDTSTPKQTNVSGSSDIYYKDSKFRYLPVINYSSEVMIRRELIEISGATISLTVVSGGEEIETQWYVAYTARNTGAYPFSVRVIGGNEQVRILNFTEDELEPEDWQDFNYDYPYDCNQGMPDFSPEDLDDGYGYFQEDPVAGTLYGEADCKDRMGFVINSSGRSADRYTAENNSRLTELIPLFLADCKDEDEREYRLIWRARNTTYYDQPVLITIGANNDLAVEGCDIEIKGLGFDSSPITSVPTLEPDPDGDYETGLCSGGSILGTVWVSNLISVDSEVHAGLARPLVAGTSVWSYRQYTLPGPGGYATVYIVG